MQQDRDILVTAQRPMSESVSGTKSRTPVIETPQSISVIARDELEVRGVQSLNAALQLTAGVTPDLRGNNADVFDQFKLRGFDVPQYLDGLRLASSQTGFATPQIDLALLDRIEVVKGPASALYGQSSPGGLIALSSKLPVDAASYGNAGATYGNFDLYRLDGDLGGRVNATGTILYRVYGSINGADAQQTFGKRRRYTGSASVTLGAGGPTTLTLLGNYSHDPFNGNYGVVPRIGSLDPNPNGRISRDFADGDPNSTRLPRDQGSVTYLLDQSLGGTWAFHARGRYNDVKVYSGGTFTTGIPIDATLATFMRAVGFQREELRNLTFDNQITGVVKTGALTHSLLVGAEAQFSRSLQSTGLDFFGAPPINAYNPVYGLTIPLPPTQSASDSHQRQIGVYAQDQIAIGDLRLTASGRYDWVRTHVVNTLAVKDDVRRDRKFTGRLGALYLLPGGVAPYVSYATSFQPQSAVLADRTVASPSTGRQFEGGVKYRPTGTNILLSAAYFDITQSNIVVTNPLTFVSTQSGRVTSRGVELEAKVPLFKGFTATGTYSRQTIRDVKDDNPFALGHPLIGTAKENAGAFGLYTFTAGALEGIGIGGGVRYVGKGYGGFYATPARTIAYVDVPSYTLFDAALRYDFGKANPRLTGLTARINAANLFDQRYITSCNVGGVDWCWYGSRRTATGTLGFRW